MSTTKGFVKNNLPSRSKSVAQLDLSLEDAERTSRREDGKCSRRPRDLQSRRLPLTARSRTAPNFGLRYDCFIPTSLRPYNVLKELGYQTARPKGIMQLEETQVGRV